jgi:hypothetical protein
MYFSLKSKSEHNSFILDITVALCAKLESLFQICIISSLSRIRTLTPITSSPSEMVSESCSPTDASKISVQTSCVLSLRHIIDQYPPLMFPSQVGTTSPRIRWYPVLSWRFGTGVMLLTTPQNALMFFTSHNLFRPKSP